MYSVILCGGSGTRLWPMSRKNLPKQFLKLYGNRSLLQETFDRIHKVLPSSHIFFVTNKDQRPYVLTQVRKLDKTFSEKNIIIEPSARNTAPAIALAMKYLTEKIKIDSTENVLFLPSDHYIGEEKAYRDIIQKITTIQKDIIGTIGIVPTKPETGYGYIRRSQKSENGVFSVLEFKEKPDLKTAKKYLASGKYLWNSGMYFFTPKTFFQELALHAPEIYHFFEESMATVLKKYKHIPAVSIDYAISEKSEKVGMIAGDFGWSDIGSFDSLADIIGSNPSMRHIGIDSKNVFTYSTENRLITTIGVEDLIIVETKSSVLVCKRGRAEDVKKIVEKLKESEPGEL